LGLKGGTPVRGKEGRVVRELHNWRKNLSFGDFNHPGPLREKKEVESD